MYGTFNQKECGEIFFHQILLLNLMYRIKSQEKIMNARTHLHMLLELSDLMKEIFSPFTKKSGEEHYDVLLVPTHESQNVYMNEEKRSNRNHDLIRIKCHYRRIAAPSRLPGSIMV